MLSGEGADELFGGYPTYLGHHLMRHLDRAPAGVRSLLRGIANSLPASRRKVTFEFLLRRLVRGMDAPWPDRHFKWFGRGAEVLLAPGIEPELDFEGIDASATLESPVSRATVLDYYTYLPDDLIVKNDRATMFASIEARAPFLDASLTAFAMGLPDRHRVRGATTKWLFKRAVEPWVGREPVRRRKRGLSVPVASWIDRGLRSEVDRLLEPRRLERQGLFDPKKVRQALVEHRSKRANHARSLWTAIVFEYWLERWLPESA